MEAEVSRWIRSIAVILLFFITALIPFVSSQNVASSITRSEPDSGTIREVGNDREYQTIMDAVMSSNDGDSILIHPGIYVEHLNINKSLTIKGSGQDETIIDGYGIGNTVKITSDHVSFEDLTIMNSGKNESRGNSGLTAYDAGIWIEADHFDISDCTFMNNSRVSIYFDNHGDDTFIEGCRFIGYSMNHIRVASDTINYLSIIDNHFTNDAYHIVFYQPDTVSNLAIIGNRFDNTNDHFGIGSSISFSFMGHYMSVRHSTVAYNYINGSSMGVKMWGGYDLDIVYNTFHNTSDYGISVDYSIDVRIHHNNFIKCNQGDTQGENLNELASWNSSDGSGNYWDDYASRYPNASSSSGHWDTPYLIDGDSGASDQKPLLNPTDISIKETFPPEFGEMPVSMKVYCGEDFRIYLPIKDLDTALSELMLTIDSGPDWISISPDGHLSGFIPGSEIEEMKTVKISVTDGVFTTIKEIILNIRGEKENIGMWTFPENGSTTANDQSDYQNHGQLKDGADWYRGLSGSSVFLNGSGAHVECGPIETGSFREDYTIMISFYPLDDTRTDDNIIHAGDKSWGSIGWGISLDWNMNGHLKFWINNVNGNPVYFMSYGLIQISAWNHIVITYDGQYGSIFINGEKAGNKEIDIELPTSSDNLIFGDKLANKGGYLGLLDEIGIWNYPFSEDQIGNSYDILKEEMTSYQYPDDLEEWIDRDRDLLPDAWEKEYLGTMNEDYYDDHDEDGLTNGEEYKGKSNPSDRTDPYTNPDMDNDGMPDSWEIDHFGDTHERPYYDYDYDGLTNIEEYEYGSDPTDYNDPDYYDDLDDDGLPDYWEISYFDNLNQDPYGDYDHDGYSERDEYLAGTDPTDRYDYPYEEPPETHPSEWLFILVIVIISIIMLAIGCGVFILFRFLEGVKPYDHEI